MFEGKLALRILLTSFDTNLPLLTDPSLHHHVARAAGAHAARPRGEELAGARAQAARGPLQANARRGEHKIRSHTLKFNPQLKYFFSFQHFAAGFGDGEHPKEPGDREDDR